MFCRYKTAQFKGYFLGAWAVLDILFKFAPGMESGRKNEGSILDLLMQFNTKLYVCQKYFNTWKILKWAVEGPHLHASFLWCVHYIKIFLFMSFFHINMQFFTKVFMIISLIWSLIYFPLEYTKITRSWFCMYSRGGKKEMPNFKSRKNQGKSPFSLISLYRTY